MDRRHDLILHPLQQQYGAAQCVHRLDGRALLVERLLLGVSPHEPVEVARFEHLSIPRQRREVADSVEGCPGPEDVPERKRAEGRVPPRAPPVNTQPVPVSQAFLHEVPGAVAHIVDVHDPPRPPQAAPVIPTVPRGAAVVDVQDREAAARPVLYRGVERRGRRARRSAVGLDEERRGRVGRADVPPVLRGVVVPVGRTERRGEFDLPRDGDQRLVERQARRAGEGRRRRSRFEVPPVDARGGARRPADEVQVAVRTGGDAVEHRRQAVPLAGVLPHVRGGRIRVADVRHDQDRPPVFAVLRDEPPVVVPRQEGVALLSEAPTRRGTAEVPLHRQYRRTVPRPVKVVVPAPVRQVVELPRRGVEARLHHRRVPVPARDELVLRRRRHVRPPPLPLGNFRDAKFGGVPRHVGMIPRHVRDPRAVGTQPRRRVEVPPRRDDRRIAVVDVHGDDLVHDVPRRGVGVILPHAVQRPAVIGKHPVRVAVATPPPALLGHGRPVAESAKSLRDELRVVRGFGVGAVHDRAAPVLVNASSNVRFGVGVDVDGVSFGPARIVRGVPAEDVAPPLLRTSLEPVNLVFFVSCCCSLFVVVIGGGGSYDDVHPT